MCSAYYRVSLHYSCIPFTMVRVSSSVVAVVSMDSLDTLTGQPQTSGRPLLTSLSAFLSPFLENWMVGQLDDCHVTLFFSIQFAIQCSINRVPYRHLYIFIYKIHCSDSHFFISALASSPTLGAKLCHILDLYM